MEVRRFQQYEVVVCHVCGCCGHKAGVCQYLYHIRSCITQVVKSQLITRCVHHRFDDDVKEDAHGVFTCAQATRFMCSTVNKKIDTQDFFFGICKKGCRCGERLSAKLEDAEASHRQKN